MLDSDRAASRRGQPLDAPLNCGPTGHARRVVMATARVVPSGGTLLLDGEPRRAGGPPGAGGGGRRVLAPRGGEVGGEFAYGIVRQLFEPLLASVAPELRA